MKYTDVFAERFYCRWCGSMTAIKVANGNMGRCMGCLKLFKRGEPWIVLTEEETRMPPSSSEAW